MSIQVAIVSADPHHWQMLSSIISGCGLLPFRCETLAALTRVVGQEPFRLALCDEELPDGNYRQLISSLARLRRSVPVVVISPVDDSRSYLNAMLAGAFDYVALPGHPSELERAVAAALTEGFDEPQPTALVA